MSHFISKLNIDAGWKIDKDDWFVGPKTDYLPKLTCSQGFYTQRRVYLRSDKQVTAYVNKQTIPID